MVRRKRISLSHELDLVMKSIAGTKQLAILLADSPPETGLLTWSVVAVLTAVEERVRLLDRAVRGTVDPLLLWCAENNAMSATDSEDEADIFLVEWSDKRRARQHRRELKRARWRLRLRRLSVTEKTP